MEFSPKILQQAVILGLFFTNSAMAHSLHLFADYDGNAISGKAYYSDQTPAAETYVEAIKTGETNPTVYGKTDASGHFSLPLNQTGTFTIVVEGMEGHRVEAVVQAKAVATNTTASVSTAEITLLREEIDQLKNKIYWRDVLGSIGYILGFFGFWALLKNKRGSD